MAEMTPEQLKLARHALGLPNKAKCSYPPEYLTETKKIGGRE